MERGCCFHVGVCRATKCQLAGHTLHQSKKLCSVSALGKGWEEDGEYRHKGREGGKLTSKVVSFPSVGVLVTGVASFKHMLISMRFSYLNPSK